MEITKVIAIKIHDYSNLKNIIITEESENIEKIFQLLEEVIILINENGSFEYASNIFSEYFYKILLIILYKIIIDNDKRY